MPLPALSGSPGEGPCPDPGYGWMLRMGLLTPGDAENALLCFFDGKRVLAVVVARGRASCHAWDPECRWSGPVRILVAVVHYWDPEGSGHHGSLRPNPRPRIEAFQQQLLGLMRLSQRQAQLTMETLTADPANKAFQHQIDIKVITDGEHHVLDQLDPPFRGLFQMVVAKPEGPKHLGFEAQRFLASRLDEAYDLYAYFEDDLIILDPGFFRKIDWFRGQAGDDCVLLPHRIEFSSVPDVVDRFFIDGPIAEDDLRRVIPDPSPAIGSPLSRWDGLFRVSPQSPFRLLCA